MTDFANSELFESTSYLDKDASQKPRLLQSDPEFTRHDWSIYISNLPQRAGVPLSDIRALVLKELVDNALDEMDRVGRPGAVTLTQQNEHVYRSPIPAAASVIHHKGLRTGSQLLKEWSAPSNGANRPGAVSATGCV